MYVNSNDKFQDHDSCKHGKIPASKKKEKKEKKDRGYQMFEDDSIEKEEQDSIASRNQQSSRVKKQKTFKLTKKQLFPKQSLQVSGADKVSTATSVVSSGDVRREKKERKRRQKQALAEAASTQAEPPTRPVFGVMLEVAVSRSRSHDGIPLPAFFRECLDYIEEKGLNTEGIYRISGVKSNVQALINALNHQRPVEMADFDPPVIASVIKSFVRELPEPVLTRELGRKFEEACAVTDETLKLQLVKDLLIQLPRSNFYLLAWMILHMQHVIALQAVNKMSLQNVSIVFSPTMQISHRVLLMLYTHALELFSGVLIKRYVPPMRASQRMELPDTLTDVAEELAKQESLLATLHEEVAADDSDVERNAQLWEVQRVVTALRRKRDIMTLDNPEAIRVELTKQQAALNRLHREAAASSGAIVGRTVGRDEDEEREAGLWEVQRTVTLLKRKLRHLERPRGFVEVGSMSQRSTFNSLYDEPELNLTLRKADDCLETYSKTSDVEETIEPVNYHIEKHLEENNSPPFHCDEIESISAATVVQDDETSDVVEKIKDHPDDRFYQVDDAAASSVLINKKSCSSSLAASVTGCEQLCSSWTPQELNNVCDTPNIQLKFTNTITPYSLPRPIRSLSSPSSSVGGSVSLAGSGLLSDAYPSCSEEVAELLCPSDSPEDEPAVRMLLRELQTARLFEEELLAICADLRIRLQSERREMTRLSIQIKELRDDRHSSSESSLDSSDEEDEDALQSALDHVKADNDRLDRLNRELGAYIMHQRTTCADIKVQLRMIHSQL